MKEYKTHVTKWSESRGEYEQETTTPEYITTFCLYGRTETREKPLVLFAIGGAEKNGFCANWDIYADSNNYLYSIPRPESGANGTYFGDKDHIKNLIRQGIFSNTLTEYGHAVMNA